MTRQRIAIIGAGVAGLSAAWLMRERHDITLYENQGRIGGHSNTVEVDDRGQRLGIDTGFVVFNDWNYPNLQALFRKLGIADRTTDMSFSLSVNQGELEWAGDNLDTLFAQRSNLVKPGFLGMVAAILRFNRAARHDLEQGGIGDLSLGEWLARRRFSNDFRRLYLLPMAAAIWSCPPAVMADFPAESFLRFFANHGLLNLVTRPQWRTVAGGSRRYVTRMLDDLSGRYHTDAGVQGVRPVAGGIQVFRSGRAPETYDQVVLACHGDEAAELLDARASRQRELLSAFRYQENRTLLHTDEGLMPLRRKVWSSWNYLAEGRRQDELRVSVSYWMNRLHRLTDTERQYLVSLNPLIDPRPGTCLAEFSYLHPVFDAGAMVAQARLPKLQGQDRLWFCGSYLGYGFHEDALRSAVQVAESLGCPAPWSSTATGEVQKPVSPATAAEAA